jgi:AcrR family transcriptional regulator
MLIESRRRIQLLEAAGRLFRANGFRAVTMEAIAAEAAIAKATLYSHFADKSTVFAAVADHVTRMIADGLRQGLGTDGDVDERLARGLIARHRLIFELVDGSPHARELMTARDNFARAPVEKIDQQMIAALASVVGEDARLARSAHEIANTLFFGAIGVCAHARSSDDVKAAIGRFVRPYLHGVRGLAARGAGEEASETSEAPVRRAVRRGRI